MAKTLIKPCENDDFLLNMVPERSIKNIPGGANHLFINSEIWFRAHHPRMFFLTANVFLTGQKTDSNVEILFVERKQQSKIC